jgi:hypothetical protein
MKGLKHLANQKCSRKNPFYKIKTKSDFQPIDKPKEQHKKALPPQN